MLCVLYFTCILLLFFAVTVCECHIEIKGYLFTYLLTYLLSNCPLNSTVDTSFNGVDGDAVVTSLNAGGLWPCRYSVNVENSVNDLIESLQQPLSETEREKMLRPETTHRNEIDAYTALLNYFTQRNTDALVKCEQNYARRSQHSQECKHPRRHCFCYSRPWPLTFWPQNKCVSRTHCETFVR